MLTAKEVGETLEKFYDSKAERWTQGSYAKASCGKDVAILSTEACCWCLAGAAYTCYGGETTEAIDILIDALGYIHLTAWNDAPERTFEDIQTLLRKMQEDEH